MSICPSCGAEAQAAYCSSCKRGVSGGSDAAPQASGLQDNVASALCYLFGWLTGVIFLVLAPYNANPRIRFHAFQSIFFNVGIIVVYIGITICSIMISLISGALGLLVSLLSLVLSLGIFLAWLFLMWKAYQGDKLMLPVIGALAQKQAGPGA